MTQLETFKVCAKCKLVLPHSEFFKDKTNRSGLTSYCKDCVKDYREANRQKYNDYMRSRYHSLTEVRTKQNARCLLHHAVEYGHVAVLPCAKCGDTNVYAHHPDYNKPYDVVWLCPTHHREHDPQAGGATRDARITAEERRKATQEYERQRYLVKKAKKVAA